MKQYTYLHTPLAVIAVLGFLAYLLACRPSWSPDGSKVLFPYVSGQREKAGVVLYDRDLEKATSIFSTRFEDGPGIQAQWDKRGGTAIVTCFGGAKGSDDNSLHVHLLPLKADAPKRHYRLEAEMDSFLLGTPFPQVGSSLFVGEEELIRLNLDDGTVKRVSLDGQIVLDQHEQNIFYLIEKPRSKNEKAGKAGGGSECDGVDGDEASGVADDSDKQPAPEQEQPTAESGGSVYEVGNVDPKSLQLKPFATLQLAEQEGMLPFFAVSRDGSSLAFVCQEGRQFRLLLLRNQKTQESLPVSLSTQQHAFGNLQWSPDGKTIYAVAAEKVRDRRGVSIGVAEIDAKKGVTRFVRLLQVKENDPDGVLGSIQIALSPDGNTVAAAMGFLDMGVGDDFLFLVDLGSPDRKLTKIPIPFGTDE